METYKVLFKEGETTGVYGISLVKDPAMEGFFIALSKDEQLQLKAVDTEKRIVCGAVLIPNKPIYRNQGGKEFNIIFPEETIRLASEGFLKGGHQQSSTLEHDVDTKLSGVTIVESWIKLNDVNDKSVMYGFNEPIGTWYASMKIDNNEIWSDYIKTGKVKGFSIDGFFDLEQVNLKSDINMSEQKSTTDIIVDAIKSGFASIGLGKEKPIEIKLGSVNTADGTVKINFEGDTVAANLPVTMTTPDGEMALPDGEYDLEGGMKITVSGSIVQEVATAQEEKSDESEPAPNTPMSTDAPQVKSEKVTSEVFYQLSKEEFSAMIVEFGRQVESVKAELKAEIETKLSEPISLTKTKPAKESASQTAYEKFREFNKQFN